MKEFFHYAFWVALAGLFGVAFVAVGPVATKYAWQRWRGEADHKITVNNVAAVGLAAAEELPLGPRYNVSERSFTPPVEGKAIMADLTAMKLSLYEDGQEVKTYDIVAKGKVGTAWETPPGHYQVTAKKETHFSSFGQVYMPWNLQFFGNFFIHGRPYDETGKELPDGYSGGCIRLATADAEEVYNFAKRGTDIYVYGASAAVEGKQSYKIFSQKSPTLSAQAYAAVDLESGDIILEKNLDKIYPIASLSKLLTALVSQDVINQYQLLTVMPAAVATFGTQGNLVEGETLPTGELLYPLLLESSNDAAEALARHYGRTEFITRLNDKAKAIGLSATYFDDPSGLSPKNVSSARDLAKLTRYLYQHKRFILEATKKPRYAYAEHEWINTNKLVGAEGYQGGKNGFIDESGQTQIAVFDLPVQEFGTRPVGLIVLKSGDRERDVESMLAFLKKSVVYSGE